MSGDGQVCLEFGGTGERVMGVALGLLRLTRRDHHAGAHGQRLHQRPARRRRDRLVGPPAGRDQIPIRQGGVGTEDALQRPNRRQDTHVRRGRLARVPGRRNIAGGQGRGSQRTVAEAGGAAPSSAAALTAASAAALAAPVSPWCASAKPCIPRLFASMTPS